MIVLHNLLNNIYQNYEKSKFQIFWTIIALNRSQIYITNRLRKLILILRAITPFIKSIIPQLSRFENMESLVLKASYLQINEDFITIANSYQKLKNFSINTQSINKSFDRFKIFNNLEVFELTSTLFDVREDFVQIIAKLNLREY
jgi:hypothetical protein